MKVYNFEKKGFKFSFRNPKLDEYNKLVMEYKIDGLYENLLDSEGYYYNSEFIPEKNCMSFYKVKINGVEFNGVGLPDDILCEVRELFKNLKAERENKFNQVVEELVTGQRNIYFHIVGCDYPYYQAWVRNLPKDLTGQVQDVMTSAIKKIVGKDEFVPNSCEYLEKIAKKSIGTIEDLSDVLNPELDKEIQYYHDFNSNIVTGFELNFQTILKPVIKLNKEKEKIEQQREAERRTMKVEILSKGSHGDPYADVRITDPETGESAEFSCNNIFDFGYVVNPNYPLMDGMEIGGLLNNGNWKYLDDDDERGWYVVRPATEFEKKAVAYLTKFPPISNRIRM